jgi:hypothetical protein
MFLFIESKKFESFAIGKNGVAYGDQMYDFHDVFSIWFQRVHTTQYMNFTKSAECERASMKVHLLDGKAIHLSFNESYYFIGANVNKKDWIERLIQTYSALCRATFDIRLSRFEQQLEKYGFFVYEGARFIPDESTVVCKGQRFQIGRDQCLMSYGTLDFVRGDQTFLEKCKRKLMKETMPSMLPRISTLSDTDVFFHLLHTRLGISWPSGK